MASINYAARQISVKIVYYGPGLSGKTTNLQVIHKKTPQEHRSDMVSLATETDRTLFFDFLPLDLGKIKGFATKFQLYTVPGQVYYNATRKLVLRGVDGVVFVADSGADKIQENLESFQNLEDNLAEYGYKREDLPIIIQYNKRDLPNALPIEDLQRHVNKYSLPYSEGIAYKGVGVFDTLKMIGKIVIDYLNKKYSRGPAVKTEPQAAVGGYAPPPSPQQQQPAQSFQPPMGGQAFAPPPPPQAYQQQPAPSFAPPPPPQAYQVPAPSFVPPPPQAYQQQPAPSFAPPPPQAYQQQPAPSFAPPPPQAYQAPVPSFAPPQQQYQAAPPSFEPPKAPMSPAAFEISSPFAAPPPQQQYQAAPPTFEPPMMAAPPQQQYQAAPAFEPPPMVAPPSFAPSAPAVPAFEPPMAAVPATAPAFDHFAQQQASPWAVPQSAPAMNDNPFLAPPATPAFEMPPTPPQAPVNYDDAFLAMPAAPAAPQAAPAPQAGGFEQSPFEFDMASPPQVAPASAQPSEFSFDYQPFTPPANQNFSAPQPQFGTPAMGGYQPAGSVPPPGGRSELDLEIEKYQREIEEKQKKMRSNTVGFPSPAQRSDTQEMQPYAGPGDNRYQPHYSPQQGSFSDFEAELEGGGNPAAQHGEAYIEEYPTDSAMFFTSIDRNMVSKKPIKPPVNPAKMKMAQQQQPKGFVSKLFNKNL